MISVAQRKEKRINRIIMEFKLFLDQAPDDSDSELIES